MFYFDCLLYVLIDKKRERMQRQIHNTLSDIKKDLTELNINFNKIQLPLVISRVVITKLQE